MDKFALIGNKTEAPTSILQALTLMNGELVGVATDPDKSRPVLVVTSLPGLTDEERVDILYLTALGRKPKPAELERALKHVRTDPMNPKKKYGDLLWALLNSGVPHEPLRRDFTTEAQRPQRGRNTEKTQDLKSLFSLCLLCALCDSVVKVFCECQEVHR